MKHPPIAIVDYGMGNLASVAKAFRFLKANAEVTSDPKRILSARAVVLPGVGAFGEAMAEMKKRKLVTPLVGSIKEGKPFLGLCLGLQLLFEESEESRGIKGLGLLPGVVRRLPRGRLKVPHMGWNQIEKVPSSRFRVPGLTRNPKLGTRNQLLKGIPDGAFMYFVHSYYAQPEEKEHCVAKTQYGIRFASIVSNGVNIWATQFHPEKSQRWGLGILKNFLREVAATC